MEDMQKELRERQSQEANLFMGCRNSEDYLHTRRTELEHLNTQVMLKVLSVMCKKKLIYQSDHFKYTLVKPGFKGGGWDMAGDQLVEKMWENPPQKEI